MLALVHPFTQTSEIQPPHRQPSSSSSSSHPPSTLSASTSLSVQPGKHRQRQPSQQQPPSQLHQFHHFNQSSHQVLSSSSSRLPSRLPGESYQIPPSLLATTDPDNQSFDIHTYPSIDLLKLLASLLTQIASTNDRLDANSEPQLESLVPVVPAAEYAPVWNALTSASRNAIATPSSTLTFHARHIPTITLEAYLLRIHKYCPTTNEVFLSLLVYFDRISRLSAEATGRTFVIDSYNIHRLVIAGVTVASKFFSDVFYTNSRYAKVGGLPLPELNQLELQFLLLNDFRLVISSDEMQRYADQLVIYSHSIDSPLAPLPPLSASSFNTSRTPHSNNLVGPMQAMGAIDVFSGPIANNTGFQASYYHPPIQPSGQHPTAHQVHSHNDFHSANPDLVQPQRSMWDDNPTETETETEAGETDGGETTDDEPTVRPAHSSASSDTRSLCESISSRGADDTGDEASEVDDDDTVADDIVDDEMAIMDTSGIGDRTPEHAARGREGDRTPEYLGRRLSIDRMAVPR